MSVTQGLEKRVSVPAYPRAPDSMSATTPGKGARVESSLFAYLVWAFQGCSLQSLIHVLILDTETTTGRVRSRGLLT